MTYANMSVVKEYETAVDIERLVLLEVKEKEKEGYLSHSLDHNKVLTSPEIERQAGLNPLFDEILKTTLFEIDAILDEKIGKIGHIIEVNIEKDCEFPQWIDTVITIKVPIDPNYVIPLWLEIEERIRKKIRLIRADPEEIERISYHLDTVVDILE